MPPLQVLTSRIFDNALLRRWIGAAWYFRRERDFLIDNLLV